MLLNPGPIVFLTLTLTNCDNQIDIAGQCDIETAKSEIATRLRTYEDAMANGDKVAFANLYFAHAKGKWNSTGKYLVVWKKVNGEWQIFKDTWFADPKEEE